MLIVDWGESLESHTFTTSFLLPGSLYSADVASGRINMLNPTGGNVKVQALLRSGQTASRQNKFVSNDPPPNEEDPAQYFTVSQTGTYVCFATLITAYDGTTPSNVSASIVGQVKGGRPVQILLNKNGVEQTVSLAPPALTRLSGNGRNNGSAGDIAYDANGNLHMAFYDRAEHTLKYSMRDTTGRWSIVETVDNGEFASRDPSIAVDSNGYVGIAYYDSAHGDLKYASFKGAAGWNVETVDSKGNTGQQPSLAFSRTQRRPSATTIARTKTLKLAIGGSNGGWKFTTIDAGTVGGKDVGQWSHLMLDLSRPTETRWAIAYQDTSAGYTMYAINGRINGRVSYSSAINYSFFKVDHSIGGYISLAFDNANRASISHYDQKNADLRFAKTNISAANSGLASGGIVFSSSTIASRGRGRLVRRHYYDSTGKPVVLYFDRSHNKLAKARLTSAWKLTTLVVGGREIHVSKHGATGVHQRRRGRAVGAVRVTNTRLAPP